MSLYSRRTLLLAFLPLAACVVAPAYGPDGAARKLLGQVRVADPSDKNAFDLVQRLEERLGSPANARYALTYSIRTEAVGVGITAIGSTTRFNLKGQVDWVLFATGGATRLAGGTVGSFTAYAATGSTVAGLAAEEDAALRLMRILADQIVTRLIAVAANLP